MSKDDLSYEDLLQIIDLVEKSARFSEFHLKVGDIEIDLSKQSDDSPGAPESQPAAGSVHGGEVSNDLAAAATAPAEHVEAPLHLAAGAVLVKSPMVGTVYRAPEPGAKPFVEAGSRVAADTTLCIIEVMKLMNSIPAGTDGVVSGILVDNGAPVEFGQVLFVIDPAA